MIKCLYTILFFSIFLSSSFAQYADSIREIQAASEEFSSEMVLLRCIEGAGFRYYWAAEGISEENGKYVPCTNDCRSTRETIEHIYGLSIMLKNTVMGEVSDSKTYPKLTSISEYITETNKNWVEAANFIKNGKAKISEMKIKFPNGNEVPFWNLINGPLQDAIYHSGQIVVFRRAAGNPANSKVNVFMGKLNN